MPRYILKDGAYNIPEDAMEDFERENPDAMVEYEEEGVLYNVPINDREAFLAEAPNATYTKKGYTLDEMKAASIRDYDRERHSAAPEPSKAEEMKATPMTEQYSVTPKPSKSQEKFGLDSGIPSIAETAKGMIEGHRVTPTFSIENQPQVITAFREGVKQGKEQLVAGAQYGIGEAAASVLGTSRDDIEALAEIERLQAEGKDVAEETKNVTDLSAVSPIVKKGLELMGAGKAIGEAEKITQRNRTIQKALKENEGDVDKAKEWLESRAGKQTWADEMMADATYKMAQAKPTKGWGWVGSMIPQMVGTGVGLAASMAFKSPLPAQILGGANMAGLTLSTAGSAMAEARQAGASNSQVWAAGILNGAVELLTEKIPYNRYVGRITDAAKNSAKQALGKAVTEVGSPANKELKDLLSKANKRLDGKLFSGKNVEDYMGDLMAEGLSEATAEGLQTILPILYENPENYPTFMEILGNSLEGAKGGVFMGMFLGGASKAAEHRMNRARRKAQGYVDVAEVTTPDGKDEIVEVVRNEQDQPVFLWNGEQIPISKNNVKQRHQFNFDDFERGQFQLEEDEAYENGKTLETPAEMTDANNMYEIKAAEIRERFGLGEDADEETINIIFNGDAFQAAMKLREQDEELSDLILDYTYAKATRDGIIDAARDHISEEQAQSDAIIDYRKNKTDGMIHPATLKTKDANGNDRQVYVVSGNIVTFEDGTINTQESDNDIIIQDAVTGKPEFAMAKDLLRAEQALDPEVEKQNVRNTIADTIATEVENKMNNVLSFNVGDAYNIIGADGAEHSVQVMADNGDGSVMASIDNAEAVAMPKSEIQQLSNEYNMNRARLANEAQKEAKQSEKMMQESQNVEPTQEEVAEVAPAQRIVPTTKDGKPDFNAMDAEMFVEEYASRYGEDSAAKIARKNISVEREKIAKIDKKIDDVTDPNQMDALFEQKAASEAVVSRYSEILERLGLSEDVNETEDDQKSRLRNEAGNRIASLFPDGMPNVESFILADIATGNRIRWSDKVTNGVVTSRGLGAELGLSDSKQERTRRLPLIGKDAMTPEEYAESLRERLDAVGIRYDESSLRDAVLGVYQSVDSRKGAWDALENMSKKMQETQTDMDWEDMQQQMAYNKAQNDNAPALPDMPDLETIEEEAPISGEEAAEIEAQEQTEDYKLSDEVDENGRQFVLASNGNIVFGNIDEESGLTPAPILLSEGIITNPATNDGYGLVHIEARHGGQIRNAGYPSVVSFIEEVAKNYQIIKEGKNRNGNNTYMLQLTDKHNNTLMVELSGDGTYWNINTAGIFKTSYGKNRKEVYNRQTTAKQPAEVVETSQSVESNGTQTPSSLIDVSTPKSSESKDTTSEPQKQEVDEKILQEEQKVNVNPTDGQKEAGNYKKGHVVVDGFNITIEQPKGSVRSGVDADGKEWSITMNNTYGYIRGTEGVDGDHIDVFLSDNLDNWGGEVFVVDQINTDGSFDEHKVMYGFNSIEEAQKAYLSNYSEGWQGLGAITGVSKDEFKKWIESSHRKTKPFAEYKSVKATEGQAVNTTDSANLANDVTAIESNVDEKPVNKPKSDKKIEDFGEKIGGARKDVARARLLDTVKLSAKDLESLKDPDKILSRKAIIKYMEEGQMTQNDGISLLALNMATRGKYRKALTMEKYREVALQWERGEDIDVGITEQDIDKYMANMPEVARVKPNARERAIADLERIIMTPYNDYRDTYIALNYPAEYRNLRGTYIYKTAWNDKVVVVSGIDSRRGFVFSTYEQAVAKIKRDFPIVEFEKSKAKNATKDKEDSEGHLNITKDDMGWYRIKSRSIPGNIYLSGRFRTKKDAEAYLEQNKEVLLEREQKMTESLMGSNIGMVEREGVDYRNGQDVTPEDFLNTFGFRGVEFGNWVPQAERQLYLNKTYDAIMDFCNIIGISPKAFSLGGELALAFGARGKSRALAHYEPLKMVINLTRMKGAGSLAHEWFHAFDNYISKRKTGNISDMATARFAAERDEVSRAFYDLVSKMNSMDYTKRSNRAGDYWGAVEERAARLLESYIYNELESKNALSPLLVRKDVLFNEEELPEEDYVKSAWPYPSARENKEIKPYFDHLFSTLEEKVDEQGNVILFRNGTGAYERLFNELQAEYDALDKDDAEILNAWREKKADVVRSYMRDKSDELGLPTKDFVVVTNEEDMRNLYDEYRLSANDWLEENNKDFVTIDTYEKFKKDLSEANASYYPTMDIIACDVNSFPTEETKAFTVLFHEQTHNVICKNFSKKEFGDIWEEASKNDPKTAEDIALAYGDDIYENGNEYVTYIIEKFSLPDYRGMLESYIKGDETILVEDFMKYLKETLPLRNNVIKQILKIYKNGYRKEGDLRAETRSNGFGREYEQTPREIATDLGGGESQSDRERRRNEVVKAATDLASSLGVKMTIIEDLNEINDSNPKMRKSKRGSKAWYNITTDEVVFVAPNATSVFDAMQSVWHEVVAHKGLRDVVGRENFNRFLDKVFQSATPEIRSQIVRLAAQNGWDFRTATEEYLASLAEEGFDSRENRTFWQKVRDLFMDMLREAKIAIGYNITDNDMRYMLWRTYQMQKKQGAMAVTEDVLMQQKLGVGNFRTRPAGTRQMTEKEQIIADAKANGTYLKAPNGNDTNLTPKQWAQVRTKAFKEWFGDWEYSPENASKIVDANGEPKVVYNGSKVQHYLYDGRLRTKGQSATNSKVSFFTDNKDVAERYGKFVNEVFLNIRNPYEIDYNGAGWQGWSGAADGMQRASTDSYADLLANGSVDSTLERIIENYGRAEADYLASGSVRNKGVAPDGVIAYNVADPIRSTLYIVRNAEAKDISRNSVTPKGVETFTELGKASLLFDSQIKSATDNVGTFDANNDDIRFRTKDEATTPSPDENADEPLSKEEKLQKDLKSLRKAVIGTKSIRKALAALVASRVRREVTDDIINVMGKSEFNALVKQIQDADVDMDIVKPLERISEIITDLNIKDKENKIFNLLSLKVQGENKSGVSIAKSVDNSTRKLFNILASDISRPKDEIRAAYEGKVDDLILNMALDISEKYQQAKSLMRDNADINNEIKDVKEENTALRKQRAELNKDGKVDEAKALGVDIQHNKEKISALEAERLANKERIEHYLGYVQRALTYSAMMGQGSYKTLMYHNMMHNVDMVNMAIRDVDTGQTLSVLRENPTRFEKAKENVRALLFSPARSLNYLLKRITVNAPNGEGRLYDYFVRGKNGYIAASENFYEGYNEFKAELNNKAKDIFGKPYKDVLADSDKPSDVTITVKSGDREQDVQLTIGQAMYLYMVNKMADGKVKLTKMGIFDADVEAVKNSLPARYITFADWLQNKFLPKKREKYNDTHLKVFGTEMASIDGYVPMKVKKDEVYQEVDGTEQDGDRLPTTITGSIINRRRNGIILDLTTNALDLMLSHGEEMEHWNAYTPVVRDMNSLLSNTKFKLLLNSRVRGIYEDLKAAAQIAVGQYTPKTDAFNKLYNLASKGVVSSKIAFRLWTAMKQMLSFPAFMAYSSSASYQKNLMTSFAKPYDAWKWGMENLPILHKRWSSRSLGNERLAEVTEGTFGKILDGTAKVGMLPNAFVDALTCAIGAKAVYDYKVKEYQTQMYSKEESEYRALIDATVAFNESQQSNEGLFLSQIQANKDGLSMMVSTFNNSNYGYLRKMLEAAREMTRKKDAEVAYLRDKYIEQGMSAEDANMMAEADVNKTKRTAVLSAAMYGFLLNTIWTTGSNVFKYLFADDDDEDESLIKDVLISLGLSPVRNTAVGSWAESIINGFAVNPSLLLGEVNKLLESIKADENKRWDKTTAYLAIKMVSSMAVGADIETLVRIYEGIEGMVADGVDVEDIMALVSAPRSQALMAAREPKENESVAEYQERMAKIDRRIDSRISDSLRGTWLKNYYMYQLADRYNLSTARDDFGRVSIPEYQNYLDEAKVTSDREKSYRKNNIPESDMKAFRELPEYKRMTITDHYKKDINKNLKDLKGDISESTRSEYEQKLYDAMGEMLEKIKELESSNK